MEQSNPPTSQQNQEKQPGIILGYWQIRGSAQPIRFLLNYCKLNFVEKNYIYKESWFDQDYKNLGFDFPALPYLIDGEYKITETDAILNYICFKAKQQELLGKDQNDIVKVQQLICVINDLRIDLQSLSFDEHFEEKKNEVHESLLPQIQRLEQFLVNKKWLIGDYITVADFKIYDILLLYQSIFTTEFEQFTNLKKLMNSFQQIPQIVEYLKTPQYALYGHFFPPGISKFTGKKFLKLFNRQFI